jgi:hypothetical protein
MRTSLNVKEINITSAASLKDHQMLLFLYTISFNTSNSNNKYSPVIKGSLLIEFK